MNFPATPAKRSSINRLSAASPEAPLQRVYDGAFVATKAYKATLPDVQNSGSSAIQGARVPILQVGISNFRLPLKFKTKRGEVITLETSVTGTVSLAASSKGINMSRIMRTFYEFQDEVFTPGTLQSILLRYKQDLGASRARLKLSFSYPMIKPSLRSGLTGWQYYEVAYEGFMDDLNRFRQVVHFDFVYSSACPCSSELSEHAREARHQYAIPHSQRSKARVSAALRNGAMVWVEDFQALCLQALQTETQVMVKREDEQAFAELNGAHIKFVEDAARLLYEQLDAHPDLVDFQAACSHLESLHSHDAVAVINKGVKDGFSATIDDFGSLSC